MFGSVVSGTIEIFFNERETAAKEYPAFAARPLGLTGTMFIELEGTGNLDRLHDRLKTAVPVVMPLSDAVVWGEGVRDRRSRWLRDYLRGSRCSCSSFCLSASSRCPASPSLPSAVSRW